MMMKSISWHIAVFISGGFEVGVIFLLKPVQIVKSDFILEVAPAYKFVSTNGTSFSNSPNTERV